jgi:hypothetical protein
MFQRWWLRATVPNLALSLVISLWLVGFLCLLVLVLVVGSNWGLVHARQVLEH